MRVLSGIQPTGKLHIGNYFGAMRQHLHLQAENEGFYFIGLTLIDVLGNDAAAYVQWNKDTNYSENNYVVNGFGAFDVMVTDGGKHVIEPTETYTFSFSISGTETYTEADFGTLMSYMSPDGDAMEMLVAVKFVQGPDDISVFGAAVPEPATIALLGLGVLLFRRRRA